MDVEVDEDPTITELLWYATSGNIKDFDSLLHSSGLSIDSTNSDGRSALHFAACENQILMVEHLLKSGANGGSEDSHGRTPLDEALSRNHIHLVELLSINEVKEGELIQEQHVRMISSELFLNAKSGNDQQCKRLIVSGADPHCLDDNGRNLLHVAAQGGHMRTIELFTSCNVDINKMDINGETPLMTALNHGHVYIAEFLLNKGARMSSVGIANISTSPVLAACNVGDVVALETLPVEDLLQFDNDRRTTIHIAAMKGFLPVVQYVLSKHPGLVNTQDNWGNSALMEATRNGRADIVRFLVSKGGSVNKIDRWGKTPLSEAVRLGHDEVAEVLRENGAYFMSKADADQPILGDRKVLFMALKFVLQQVSTIYPQWCFGEVFTPCAHNRSLLPCSVCYTKVDASDKDATAKEELLAEYRNSSVFFIYDFGHGSMGRVWKTQRAEFVENIETVEQSVFFRAPLARRAGLKSSLVVPLVYADRVYAVLSWYSQEVIPTDPGMVAYIEGFVNAVGKAIMANYQFEHERDLISRAEYSKSITALFSLGQSFPIATRCDGITYLTEHPFVKHALVPIFTWANTMSSEKHRAVYITVVTILETLILQYDSGVTAAGRRKWDDPSIATKLLHGQVTRSLKYLLQVTPQSSIGAVIVEMHHKVSKSIAALQDRNLLTEQMPFFKNPTLGLSPIYETMVVLEEELSAQWTSYTKKDKLDNLNFPQLKTTAITSRNVFDIQTSRIMSPRSQRALQAEHAKVTQVATEILLNGEYLLGLRQIKDLHNTFDLEEGDGGVFRAGTCVGMVSNDIYRCFLPFPEIEAAMHFLVSKINSPEAAAWHPYHRAFYFYSTFVHIIHPFEDGNGRTARLITNIICKKSGAPDVLRSTDKVLSFHEFCDKAIEAIDRAKNAASMYNNLYRR